VVALTVDEWGAGVAAEVDGDGVETHILCSSLAFFKGSIGEGPRGWRKLMMDVFSVGETTVLS
jgi:hypothetical protein